jgi:hypothetical protein
MRRGDIAVSRLKAAEVNAPPGFVPLRPLHDASAAAGGAADRFLVGRGTTRGASGPVSGQRAGPPAHKINLPRGRENVRGLLQQTAYIVHPIGVLPSLAHRR